MSCIVCFTSTAFIIWGLITTINYVKYRHIRQVYTNTTCLLLNYTWFEYTCTRCSYDCVDYHCFDEYFTLLYPISNGTNITNVMKSFRNEKQHVQRKV